MNFFMDRGLICDGPFGAGKDLIRSGGKTYEDLRKSPGRPFL
jgi:hypothetical protein